MIRSAKNGVEQTAFFNEKSVMVIVPHPDDEINVAGGLIAWLYEHKIKTTVVYTTNGNYRGKGGKRLREAIDSITTLGGNENDIVWLGYSDHSANEKTHVYMEPLEWQDRFGKKQTYLCGGTAHEFCFLRSGVHHDQNRASFIADIRQCVASARPDVIVCVDFDSHPDHRAASLGFEHALGELLKNGDYQPTVFKAFAYPTGYGGKKDFFSGELKNTAYNPERFADPRFENPYYSWDERSRFEVSEKAKELFLPDNTLYRALRCHKSQNVSERADRIINADQVAWQRRTDNLLMRAGLWASSGETQYLNDFLLFDCSNIMNGYSERPRFDLGAWIPEASDERPTIRIEFDNPEEFDRLCLYRRIADGFIRKIRLVFDGKTEMEFSDQSEDLVWKIRFDSIRAKTVEIHVLARESDEAGLTEIELLRGDGVSLRPVESREPAPGPARLKIIFALDKLILFWQRAFHSLRRRFQKKTNQY